MVDRFERFSLMIADISRQWHKITTAEMEKYGLKGAHSVYLAAMARFPEGMTAGQIGEMCGKDKADVSRMMAIMEQKGLVTKQGVSQYRGIFRLTGAGQAVADYVNRRASLAVALAGRDLSDDMRAALYDALESIAGNLREISANGLPIEEAAH